MNRFDNPRQYLFDALQATLGLFVIVFVIKCLEPNDGMGDDSIAKSLIQQASKWHSMSLQDKQILYSLQHSNYAVAYLNAARHTCSDAVLERLSGMDIHKLYKAIDSQNIHVLKEIAQKIYGKTKMKSMHAHSGWLV